VIVRDVVIGAKEAEPLTIRVALKPFSDVLAQEADEAVHQERIPLHIRVSIPVDQREERIGG
jgi:hypothetical protein